MKLLAVVGIALALSVGVFECPADITSSKQVYDGDTIKDVLIKIADDSTENGEIWTDIYKKPDGIYVKIDIRVNGIDTPEKRPSRKTHDGKPRSEESRIAEKTAALEARTVLVDLLSENKNRFTVTNPKLGKYAGRIVADVNVGGVDVAEYLIEKGYAKPYDGGTKPKWEF